MARGINKVLLIGNLGADPETRFTASGAAVTNVRLATTEAWRDKQTGEQQERTEWHRVVMFNRLAEIAGEYLRKGSQVYIEGKLQTRKWQDQSGQDRYSTEIVAQEFQMLGGRGGSGAGDENRSNRGNYNPASQGQQGGYGQQQGGYGGGGQQQNQSYQQDQSYQQGNQTQGDAPQEDFADDDIPF